MERAKRFELSTFSLGSPPKDRGSGRRLSASDRSIAVRSGHSRTNRLLRLRACPLLTGQTRTNADQRGATKTQLALGASGHVVRNARVMVREVWIWTPARSNDRRSVGACAATCARRGGERRGGDGARAGAFLGRCGEQGALRGQRRASSRIAYAARRSSPAR